MRFFGSMKSAFGGSSKKKQLDQLVELGTMLQSDPAGSASVQYFNTLKQRGITPESMFLEIDKIYKCALALAREVRDRPTEGEILYNLGRLYQDPPRKTIISAKTLSEAEMEAEVTRWIEKSAEREGIKTNQPVALSFYHQALEIARREHRPVLEASCLLNIAVAHRLLGEIQEHRSYVQQASDRVSYIEDQHTRQQIERAVKMEKSR
ncbi:MAG: tetratricopeptide repeat protein [Acidobacteriota bacterium]